MNGPKLCFCRIIIAAQLSAVITSFSHTYIYIFYLQVDAFKLYRRKKSFDLVFWPSIRE